MSELNYTYVVRKNVELEKELETLRSENNSLRKSFKQIAIMKAANEYLKRYYDQKAKKPFDIRGFKIRPEKEAFEEKLFLNMSFWKKIKFLLRNRRKNGNSQRSAHRTDRRTKTS